MTLGRRVFDCGFGELFLLGLKRPKRETGYSPTSNTEFNNRRKYTSLLHISSCKTKKQNYENLSALDTSALPAALSLLELMLGY